MDNKEAIDFAESYLMQQKERCMVTNATTRCVYWRPDGNMCLIGAMLGSELAQELATNVTTKDLAWSSIRCHPHIRHPQPPSQVRDVLVRAAAKLEGVNEDLLTDLQALHDYTDADREPGWERSAEGKQHIQMKLRSLRKKYV